jgi:murein DD-endopeptidase MepM/ murein hydrolase activator NlpD
MSLNLHISRRKPRRSHKHIYLLLFAVLFAIMWLAWQQGWQPQRALAFINQAVISQVPVQLPQLSPIPSSGDRPAQPGNDNNVVVMVEAQVLENPQSDAYTAGLYTATGKDEIPWPNIDGRTSVEIYTVQAGDSLWAIANQFGLDIDTLRWSNPELERNPDVLSVGTELRILPVIGAFHTVEGEETIEEIAALYGVSPDDISDYPPNGLFPPYQLEAGDGLIVPFGRKGVKLLRPSLVSQEGWSWPISGVVSGGFDAEHPALDIGAPYGSTVYAAAAGTITYSDWAFDGYGYTVIVDHGNGRETWYNHLKGALLPAGNVVERGTPVGEVGSTGHSSGPHVHFEVRDNGKQVNPLSFLPGDTPQ